MKEKPASRGSDGKRAGPSPQPGPCNRIAQVAARGRREKRCHRTAAAATSNPNLSHPLDYFFFCSLPMSAAPPSPLPSPSPRHPLLFTPPPPVIPTNHETSQNGRPPNQLRTTTIWDVDNKQDVGRLRPRPGGAPRGQDQANSGQSVQRSHGCRRWTDGRFLKKTLGSRFKAMRNVDRILNLKFFCIYLT